MNAHAIPNRKLRYFASVLFFLNGIDDLIHEKYPFPARAGEQFPAGYFKLQPLTESFNDLTSWRFNDQITPESSNR